MSKKLKVSFILFLAFAAIIVAFSTLSGFFRGVGVGFVALCGLLVATIVLMSLDKESASRVKDLFFIACAFLFVEFIIYFALEFNIGSLEVREVFWGIQFTVSLIALLYFAYVAFRFVAEYNGKKFAFVESLLGNSAKKPAKKEKKAKELTNGALEDKPNNLNRSEEAEDVYVEDSDEE